MDLDAFFHFEMHLEGEMEGDGKWFLLHNTCKKCNITTPYTVMFCVGTGILLQVKCPCCKKEIEITTKLGSIINFLKSDIPIKGSIAVRTPPLEEVEPCTEFKM